MHVFTKSRFSNKIRKIVESSSKNLSENPSQTIPDPFKMDPNSQKIDEKHHEELRSLKMTPKWSQEGDVRGQEGRQVGLTCQVLLDPRPWGRPILMSGVKVSPQRYLP